MDPICKPVSCEEEVLEHAGGKMWSWFNFVSVKRWNEGEVSLTG